MSANTAVDIVRQAEHQNNAATYADSSDANWTNPSKALVDRALEQWSMTRMRADNTSVVIIMLDPPGPPKREQLLRNTPQQFLVENDAYDEAGDNQTPQVVINPNKHCSLFEHNGSKTLIALAPIASSAVAATYPATAAKASVNTATDATATVRHSPIPFGFTFDANGDTTPNTLSYEYAYAAAYNPMIRPQMCDPIEPILPAVSRKAQHPERKRQTDEDTYSLTCLESRSSSSTIATAPSAVAALHQVVEPYASVFDEPAAIVTVVTTDPTAMDHMYSAGPAAHQSDYSSVQHDHHHRYLPPPGSSSVANSTDMEHTSDEATYAHNGGGVVTDEPAAAGAECFVASEENILSTDVANADDISGLVAVDDECIVMETEDECIANYLEDYDSAFGEIVAIPQIEPAADAFDTFSTVARQIDTNETITTATRMECSSSNGDNQPMSVTLQENDDDVDDEDTENDVNIQIHEISSSSPKEKENHHHNHHHHHHHEHRTVVCASASISNAPKTPTVAATPTSAPTSSSNSGGTPSPYRRIPMALRSAKRLSMRMTRSSKLPRTPSFDSRTKKPKTTVKRSVAHKSPHRPHNIGDPVCIPSRVSSSLSTASTASSAPSSVRSKADDCSRSGTRTASSGNARKSVAEQRAAATQPQLRASVSMVGMMVQGLSPNRTLRSRNTLAGSNQTATTTPTTTVATTTNKSVSSLVVDPLVAAAAAAVEHHRRVSAVVSTLSNGNADRHGPRLRDRVKSHYQQLLQQGHSRSSAGLVRSLPVTASGRSKRQAVEVVVPLSATNKPTASPSSVLGCSANNDNHTLRTRGSSGRLTTLVATANPTASLLSLSSCLNTASGATTPIQRKSGAMSMNKSSSSSASSSTKAKVAALAAAATSRSRFRKRLTR